MNGEVSLPFFDQIFTDMHYFYRQAREERKGLNIFFATFASFVVHKKNFS